MTLVSRIHRNTYADSVALMRATAEVQALPGVTAAALVMGTPVNRELLAGAGLLPPDAASDTDAGPADLLIAVRAEDAAVAEAALTRAEALLRATPQAGAGRPGGGPGAPGDPTGSAAPTAMRPRSIVSAARRAPFPNLAVISVPGPYAALEAQQALSAGLHVFLFSDGVPLADEVRLKQRARRAGLLVMGPECGTSLVNGVGLGFANRVRRGRVGLVGASGTGLQEVTSLVHRLGAGVSHALGTGGRDLSEAIGGLTTLQALGWLGADPETRVIVLVSKPPSRGVAETVLRAAAATGKPVVACLLGWQGATPAGVRAAATLEEAARCAVEAAGVTPPELVYPGYPDGARPARRTPGHVLGLFTGGTLCDEARRLVGDGHHRFVDFGEAHYTRGRPHPMIDPTLRSAAVLAAGDDASVSVLLADVVLGDGAHPDPAGALATAAREARVRAEREGRTLQIVAHVVGTDDDPQGLSAQEASLRGAEILVLPTNRLAAEAARDLAAGPDAA